jgi:RNA polymerase sigma-70 factor (ECF subfamily)
MNKDCSAIPDAGLDWQPQRVPGGSTVNMKVGSSLVKLAECDSGGRVDSVKLQNRQAMTFEVELVSLLGFLQVYARRLTHNREEASDLVQDTCEKALRFRHLFERGTSVRAWVLTIMRHQFLDTARGKARAKKTSAQCATLGEWTDRACAAPRAEQILLVREALQLAAKRLSAEQIGIFWSSLGGSSQDDCAALLRVPRGTVATRLHRARVVMRRACH